MNRITILLCIILRISKTRKPQHFQRRAFVHDEYRIEYMRKHIEQMKEAIHDGVELVGYTCWGCTDLVSASTGDLKKRYGLIYVDKNDDGTGNFARIRKDSFYWYKRVIDSCGEKL